MSNKMRTVSCSILIALLAQGCTLNPRPWTLQEKMAASYFLVAHTANAFSTEYMLDSEMHELNPLMGRHPSDREVAVYFSVTGVAAVVIAHFCPQIREEMLRKYATINAMLAQYDYRKASRQ